MSRTVSHSSGGLETSICFESAVLPDWRGTGSEAQLAATTPEEAIMLKSPASAPEVSALYLPDEGKYLIEVVRSDSDPSRTPLARRLASTWQAVDSQILLPVGAELQIGETRLTLPPNHSDIDPYIALRRPVLGTGNSMGVLLEQAGSHYGEAHFGVYAAHTDIGAGSRKNNEDGFFKVDLPARMSASGATLPATVLTVLDGMGGPGAGEIAVESIAEALKYNLQIGETLHSAFRDCGAALERRNSELQHARKTDGATQKESTNYMGACVVAAEILPHAIRFGHCGDARGLLLQSRALRHRTKDHSLVQTMVDAGFISERDALTHDMRRYVTEAIQLEHGRINDYKIGVSEWFPLTTGSRIILASDALWDSMLTDEVIETVASCETPEEAVVKLRFEIQKRGLSGDNVCILVYDHLLPEPDFRPQFP